MERAAAQDGPSSLAAQHGRIDLGPKIWLDGDWLGVRDGHDVGVQLGGSSQAGERAS